MITDRGSTLGEGRYRIMKSKSTQEQNRALNKHRYLSQHIARLSGLRTESRQDLLIALLDMINDFGQSQGAMFMRISGVVAEHAHLDAIATVGSFNDDQHTQALFRRIASQKDLLDALDSRNSARVDEIIMVPLNGATPELVIVLDGITRQDQNVEEIAVLGEAIGLRMVQHDLLESQSELQVHLQGVAEEGVRLRQESESHRQENAELKAQVETLEETENQIVQREKLAVVGRLASCVAHEINNPCAFIQANVEFVEDFVISLQQYFEKLDSGADAEHLAALRIEERIDEQMHEIPEILEDTADGIRRITKIVRELRSFGRVDEEQTADVNLNHLIHRSVRLLQNEIRHRAVVRTQIEDPPDVHGHAGRLMQVLINLVMNALQAMKSSIREENEIVIGCYEDNGRSVITVADNGMGIPKENLDKIFEPFYTTKDVNEGTGLGLSICRDIVQSHGGTLEVQSVPQKGTTFFISLPQAKGNLGIPLDTNVKATKTRQRPEMPRLKLLIVDDDEQVLSIYKRFLSRFHDISPCESANQALEVLGESQDYDAIICDIMMPDVSGPDFYRYITGIFPQLKNRFIFVTGGVFTPDTTHFVETTNLPVLQKPFDWTKLEEMIQSMNRHAKPIDPEADQSTPHVAQAA